MSINYKSDSIVVSRPHPPLMLLLMLINMSFALAVLGAWTYVSTYVAEPIAWATWQRVYRTGQLSDMFEYPFSVLWMMPLMFVGLAWSADKLGARSLAWTCCLIPLLINGLIVGWFYLAPLEWR